MTVNRVRKGATRVTSTSSVVSNMKAMSEPTVLCIGGLDPLGLSGVTRDIQALNQIGVHGAVCLTANTEQDHQGFYSINAVAAKEFESQLDRLNALDSIQVVKLGLLATEAQIQILLKHPILKQCLVVCDPVIAATTGAIAFTERRVAGIRKLLPLVDVLTPNLEEFEDLFERPFDPIRERELAEQGTEHHCFLYVKGGHGINQATDWWISKGQYWQIEGQRQINGERRGTGCYLASLLAGALAQGHHFSDAMILAKRSLSMAISTPAYLYGVAQLPIHSMQHNSNAYWPKVRTIDDVTAHAFPCCQKVKGVYPIVDRAAWLTRLLPSGVTVAQIRIKDLCGEALKQELRAAINIARQYGCGLYINDHWQLAIELGAYGVHLGQEDLDTADLEQIHSAGLRLGLSSHGHFEVCRSVSLKPSYLAFGPVYETQTKVMPWIPQGPEGIGFWRSAFPSLKWVAIGGIKDDRFEAVKQQGVDAIAMVSAITDATSPELAINDYVRRFRIEMACIDVC